MAATHSAAATSRYWVVIPAAGSGRRMGSDVPKQYLTIQGQAVLTHTLQRLAQIESIAGMVVAIAPDDQHWSTLPLAALRIPIWTVTGGKERADSVMNALDFLSQHAYAQDWVLVHDAARPCVRQSDIRRLMGAVQNEPAGGILAIPVRDTMKRADAQQHISATVDRNALWHALTPQLFRFGLLQQALQHAATQHISVTDEAMAVEMLGQQPLLIEGAADNIKITRQADLMLAEFYLQQQQQSEVNFRNE